MLTMTPPTGSELACRSAKPSMVSWTGISSRSVTRWTTVWGEAITAMTRSACLRIGPAFASPDTSELTLRNFVMRPVGGRVEDDGVVASSARLVLAPDDLDGLAGEQDVAQSRGDRGDEVDGAHAPQRGPGPTHVVEGLEVVQQRVLRVDRQRPHLAAAGSHGHLALLVRQRWGVEELGDALPALDLDEQGAPSAPGQGEGQRRGDGRLAGAALAGDDVQAHVGPEPFGCRRVGRGRGSH